VYTVPHIKDTYGTCTNFCFNKASVTWPYGKLGWDCIRAWYADGNTCNAVKNATCNEKFGHWMDVALCQCQGRVLPNEWVPRGRPTPEVITTTTTQKAKASAFPWWLLWLLLALCLLCICGFLLFRCCKSSKKPPIMKRSVPVDKWIRISEGTQTPAAVEVTRDTNLYQAQTQTPTVAMVQPFETVVEVVPQSRNLIETVQTVMQPVTQTLFDMIDTNHDGVITRQELAAAGASSAQASTQSFMVQQQTSVGPSEPIQSVPPTEPVMNKAPVEPVMNMSSMGLGQGTMQVGQGTMQVVPTTQMLTTETQVLPVQEQQMDLLTVTPWGYSVNHMAR